MPYQWIAQNNGDQGSLTRPAAEIEQREDNSNPSSSLSWRSRLRHWKDDRLTGWRGGLAINITVAAGILMLNVILLTVSVAKYGLENSESGILYEGSCSKTKILTIISHLFINIFSTLLLSASNYTMQVLTAPSRQDIDRAHAAKRWLTVGIQDLGHFRILPKSRALLWSLLALSSLPLHLMYNSVIFERIGGTEYAIAVVTPQFLDGSPFHISAINKAHNVPADGDSIHTNLMFNRLNHTSFIYNSTGFAPYLDPKEGIGLLTALQSLAVNGSLTYKNRTDCMKAYETPFGSDYRNVLAVTQVSDDGNSSVKWMEKMNPLSTDTTSWTCRYIRDGSTKDLENPEGARPNPKCSTKYAANNSTNWAVGYYGFRPENSTHSSLRSYPISHCLVEPMPPGLCSLNYDLWLLITVILANTIKVVVMTTTILKVTNHPFITLGDAITSFLEYPDSTTKERCLVGNTGFLEKAYTQSKERNSWEVKKEQLVKRYKSQEYNMLNIRSPCISDWLFIAELHFNVIICSLTKIWSRSSPSFNGLLTSTITPQALTMGLSLNTTTLVIIANTPQLFLSLSYLLVNRLVTAVSVSREWAAFAMSRKGLRTTKPVGSQRSTYWLQVPYRFALPMMACSAVLHYITSQVLFFSEFRVYKNNLTLSTLGEDTRRSALATTVSGLGYSDTAWLMLCISMAVLFFMIVVIGCLVCKSRLPPIRFCSAVISAACHRPDWDPEAHKKQLQWGEVTSLRFDGEGGEIIGHCCFTSDEVVRPEEGRLYA